MSISRAVGTILNCFSEMRCYKAAIWFLLVYLVLFLNLGPSLHRAHFFGIHTHCQCDANGCESDTCDTYSLDSDSGAMCLHCAEHIHQTEHVDLTKHVSTPDWRSSHGQCSVCKFFDNYFVTLVTFEQPLAQSPNLFHHAAVCPSAYSHVICAIARGPPHRLA